MSTIDVDANAVRVWLAGSLRGTAEWRENVAADFPEDSRNSRAAAALRSAADYVEAGTKSDGVARFVAFASRCAESGITLAEGDLGPEGAKVAARYCFDRGGYEPDEASHERLLGELYAATVEDAQDWYAGSGSPIEAMQMSREASSQPRPGRSDLASPEERRAAGIVANIRGALYREADHGKAGGTASHDFDLTYSDSREAEPLEVTSAATPGAVATRVALRENPVYPAPSLDLAWLVVPPMSVGAGVDPRTKKPLSTRWPIDKRHPDIVGRLKALEEAGVDRFPYGDFANLEHEAYEAVSWLTMHLQVGSGRRRLGGEEPHVQYIGSYGGVGRGDLLSKVLLAEANEPGNRGKLSGRAACRHLFVRIDQTSGDAWVAVRQGELPEKLDIPSEVTHLWVWADDLRAFEFTREHGWIEHEVPIEVLMNPEMREAPDERT